MSNSLARIKLGEAKTALETAIATMESALSQLPADRPHSVIRSAIGNARNSIDYIDDELDELKVQP